MWGGLRLPAVLRWLQALSVLGALLVLRALGLIADAAWWVIIVARPLAPHALEQLLAGDGGLGATIVALPRERKRGTAS